MCALSRRTARSRQHTPNTDIECRALSMGRPSAGPERPRREPTRRTQTKPHREHVWRCWSFSPSDMPGALTDPRGPVWVCQLVRFAGDGRLHHKRGGSRGCRNSFVTRPSGCECDAGDSQVCRPRHMDRSARPRRRVGSAVDGGGSPLRATRCRWALVRRDMGGGDGSAGVGVILRLVIIGHCWWAEDHQAWGLTCCSPHVDNFAPLGAFGWVVRLGADLRHYGRVTPGGLGGGVSR